MEKIKFRLVSYVVLFLLLGFIFFLVITKFTIKTYYQVLGTVNNEEVLLTVPINVLQDFLKTDIVRIDNKIYSYKLIGISEEVSSYDNQLYKQASLEINLPKKLLKENNTFIVGLSYKKKNIFKILRSCFKE